MQSTKCSCSSVETESHSTQLVHMNENCAVRVGQFVRDTGNI